MKNFKAGTVTRPTEKLNMRIALGGQKGFTLIEIVMVIVILGVIGAFTFQFVAHGVQAFKKSSTRKDLYDQGRLALERMVRELRDAKEVTGSAGSSITFKKAHPAQAADNTEEIKFELNGTNLERVGDPSGTPATAVLASNVSSFTVTYGGGGGGGGGGPCTITLDNVSSATPCGSCSSRTFSHSIGSGTNRLLVVGVSIENDPTGPAVSSITYNGQTLTKIDSVEVSSDGTMGRTELWYLLEADLPGSGSYNVVVTLSQSTNELAVGAISLTDVAQQAPEASNTNSNVGQDTISSNITTATDGAWLVDVVHCGEESGGFAAGAGQSERYDRVTGSSEGAGSTKPVASAGATSAGWTFNTGANRLAHVVAAFAPATGCDGGGGGGTAQFSDDFEDGTFAGTWSKVSGLDMQETGGVFTTTGNDTSHYTVDSGSAWTDYSFDVDVVANDDDGLGITFRVEDSNSFYRLEQRFGDSNWNLTLQVNDNGSWSTLGTVNNYGSSAGQVDSETTSYNFKVEVSGTNIKAYIDDVLKFDVDDSTVAGGTVGLWINWASGTDFDDVLVQSSGGNLATLEITLSSAEGGTVSMRTKVYLRNM
jgi:prepilin-type N-terminal cleavage/methylation domain-containing protein